MVNAPLKSLCILGRQPQLGLAELESLYGFEKIKPVGQIAAEVNCDPVEIDFNRLGGTVKLCRVLSRLEDHDWPNLERYLIEQIPRHLDHVPPSKFTLGLSVYGMEISAFTINRSLMKVKKSVRELSGRAIRIVPNKQAALNSAQVLHNKLTSLEAWELLLVRDKHQTILAQTIAVQDITAYGQRDQARPKRDARVGMLPPKLAQIIINLANPSPEDTIVDPFCGTGVVLQEALLMGYDVVGTDIEPRMVDYTIENIDWLRALRPQINNRALIEVGDATGYTWPAPVRSVASETYLGRALTAIPSADKLQPIINDVNTILTKFLQNLSPQLESGSRVSLAVPAWRVGKSFINLPVLAKLTDMGYTFTQFQHLDASSLIYWRAGQTVGRRLLALTKI